MSNTRRNLWNSAATLLVQGFLLMLITITASAATVDASEQANTARPNVETTEPTAVAVDDEACPFCRCRPYWDYLPCESGGVCVTCNCFWRCAEALPTIGREASVPGFEVIARKGASVVSVVYPNSPARQSGLRVGDTILAVNDIPANSTSSPLLREFPDQSHTKRYLIRRNSQAIKIEIDTIPWSEFFARATLPEGSWTEATISNAGSLIPQYLHPYLSGLVLRPSSDGFYVHRVIPHTPADDSGFTKGDLIVAVNDQDTSEKDPQLLSRAEGSDYRATLQITFRRSLDQRTIQFKLQSTTEILDRLADSYNQSDLFTSDD